MSDIGLGSIGEAVSALVAIGALVESIIAHRHSKSTKKDLDQLRIQMSTLQAQIQSLQLAQASNQKTNINVVVTTGSTGEQAAKQIDSGQEQG